MKLYETFIYEDSVTVMCIGIDEQEGMAVLAPYYADDEDCLPELHVEDGVMVFNVFLTYNSLKPLGLNTKVTRIVTE